jgi:hypothetical protein
VQILPVLKLSKTQSSTERSHCLYHFRCKGSSSVPVSREGAFQGHMHSCGGMFKQRALVASRARSKFVL